MAKIKFTKNELKKQKELLRRFTRFLPTLQLKKQQLQFEIGKIERAINEVSLKVQALGKRIEPWIDVFAANAGLSEFFGVEKIDTEVGNVAGVDMPVFKAVNFKEKEYDLFRTPLWVDAALIVCKEMIVLRARLAVYSRQQAVLKEELRITTQRVNLFEQVKIPEAKENIRVIRIYLGDVQTAEVVRGKIAKAKIGKEEREERKLIVHSS